MDNELRKKLINTIKLVADDAKKDAEDFDGKPFDGKTVATYFGYHGAAIAALSDVLLHILHEILNRSKGLSLSMEQTFFNPKQNVPSVTL